MGKFREIDYVRVRDLAVAGASRSAIAQACGLTEQGFYARLKKDEQLAEAVAADGRSRHRNGKPAEPAAEPALEPVQLEADGSDCSGAWDVTEDDDQRDADAVLAEQEFRRREMLDLIEEAVYNGFNLTRAIAYEIDEPIWKVANALEELEAEGKVERVETATFTAYVSPGTVPAGSRPVLNGEGGVTFVTGDEDQPETPVCADNAHTAASDEEVATVYALFGIDPAPECETTTTADEEGEPIWWCLGCGDPVDLDSPASVVLRPQRRAWCSLRCFDGAARDRPGLADVTGDESANAINPGAGISYDEHLAERAKRNLLEEIADPDCVSLAFANGGCLTLEFADVHLLALLPRERRLVRAIWKAVERFEEAGND